MLVCTWSSPILIYTAVCSRSPPGLCELVCYLHLLWLQNLNHTINLTSHWFHGNASSRQGAIFFFFFFTLKVALNFPHKSYIWTCGLKAPKKSPKNITSMLLGLSGSKMSPLLFPITDTHDLISQTIPPPFPVWPVNRDVTDNSCCFLPGQSDRQWDGSGIWGIWEDRKPTQKRRWIQVLLKSSHSDLPAAKCPETRRSSWQLSVGYASWGSPQQQSCGLWAREVCAHINKRQSAPITDLPAAS